MKVDAHNHFLPDMVIEHIRKYKDRFHTEIIKKGETEYLLDKKTGNTCPLFKEYYDYDAKIADMDKWGIDLAILSVVPNTYYYWIDAEAALELAQMSNDWVAAFSSKHARRFRGMAHVPMQDPNLALQELRRAHETLGLNALATAPIIDKVHLDAEQFYPLYAYCEANHILVYLHPCFFSEQPELSNYYNINLVGNVYQTNLGINNLIFGGILEKFPDLNIFASHGGGYFPYQIGRLRHGFSVRQEPRERISKSPEQYIGNFYFDTITHWNAALQFLVDQFGSDHVMVGTDYPFDMGDYHPVEHVGALRLTACERENIYFNNAAHLFGL